MPKGVWADPNVKARFLALALTGANISATARKLGISEDTGYSWYKKYRGKKADSYHLLVHQILGANLRAGLIHADLLGDEEFIRTEHGNVSSLALSYGILMDKAIRVLEAGTASAEPGAGEDLDRPAETSDIPGGDGD